MWYRDQDLDFLKIMFFLVCSVVFIIGINFCTPILRACWSCWFWDEDPEEDEENLEMEELEIRRDNETMNHETTTVLYKWNLI